MCQWLETSQGVSSCRGRLFICSVWLDTSSETRRPMHAGHDVSTLGGALAYGSARNRRGERRHRWDRPPASVAFSGVVFARLASESLATDRGGRLGFRAALFEFQLGALRISLRRRIWASRVLAEAVFSELKRRSALGCSCALVIVQLRVCVASTNAHAPKPY